jgi:hypothetical protein
MRTGIGSAVARWLAAATVGVIVQCVVASTGVADEDHLVGYKIKDGAGIQPGPGFNLTNTQYGLAANGCELKKPKFLLVRGEKNGGNDARGGRAGNFLCYKAKCTGAVQTIPGEDQFAAKHSLDLKKTQLVCAPFIDRAPRFADNGDGTIGDNESGLVWEKKVELDGAADYADLHDADNYYAWSGTCSVNTSKYCQPTTAAAALCAANAEDGTTGCDECTGGDGTCSVTDTAWTWAVALNNASFAGYTDWRVPTRAELQSIVDYSAAPSPAVNVAFQGPSCGGACTAVTDPDCSCTQSGVYWSASTYATIPDGAWVVDFDQGYLNADPRTFIEYVRAVRGGS